MKRSKINFIVDCLMFVLMLFVVAIGILMKFILIPGKQRLIKYGKNVELLLFGMDRHQWGTIHLILGLFLVGFLIIHLLLHWRWIKSAYSNTVIKGKTLRIIIGSGFFCLCLVIFCSLIFIKPEIKEVREKHKNVSEAEEDIYIKGYMTLKEIADTYNVPVEYLIQYLGLPTGVSTDERIGWLRNRYGFEIKEVKRAIRIYKRLK